MITPRLALVLAAAATTVASAETVTLAKVVDVRDADYEFARPVARRSTADDPLRIGGQAYADGLGTQLETTVCIALHGATRFTAVVGVDDATAAGDAVQFEVQADGRTLWRSPEVRRGTAALPVDVDVRGHQELRLLTLDCGHARSAAHADWADAKFDYSGEAPASEPCRPEKEAAYILTPPPGPAPRLNSPRVFGVRPGHPLLYTIAATGERPMHFAVDGLPEGVHLDAATGRLTGAVAKPGTHHLTLRATNARGTAEQDLRLEVGERIALTPALGWNSWNCWAGAVDQDKILRSARAMAASGLVDHGWSYINIDDTWQGARDPQTHALQPNGKFPDMKALADAVHGLGLKLGIYSTPWITSYATHAGGSADNPAGTWTRPEGPKKPNRKIKPWAIGEYSFATEDARQWAAWGIDYLKYDWNPNEPPETAEMLSALRISGRDVVYSLSNAAPFRDIGELSHLANSWRTTGDIRDRWGSLQHIGFSQEKWRPFSGPGHWNDPDMLVVGYVGWGPKLHPTNLTPSEQYTHLTLWSLLSAPLLIGCDLERLDDFTLNLLTNDEVLAVDQDPLGAQAAQVVDDGRRQVWARHLEDGSLAVGLFNLSRTPDKIAITWAQLGLTGPQQVRDLWRQQDLGTEAAGYAVELPRHGAALIRIRPAR
ncbi:MAG TPA: NPCBM/NEW2 domain-containing protein [Lacunisphaera sp.]|nr:NPCBM/NEW2 domain-containing protein [Lacunisphaera sp.]